MHMHICRLRLRLRLTWLHPCMRTAERMGSRVHACACRSTCRRSATSSSCGRPRSRRWTSRCSTATRRRTCSRTSWRTTTQVRATGPGAGPACMHSVWWQGGQGQEVCLFFCGGGDHGLFVLSCCKVPARLVPHAHARVDQARTMHAWAPCTAALPGPQSLRRPARPQCCYCFYLRARSAVPRSHAAAPQVLQPRGVRPREGAQGGQAGQGGAGALRARTLRGQPYACMHTAAVQWHAHVCVHACTRVCQLDEPHKTACMHAVRAAAVHCSSSGTRHPLTAGQC